ncbi:MAG: hemerythrin domain-containing protein [Proteobacteria bacterium]|nr:hemerythrin domain-containing protein [Pseudomonadota bacterium]
MSMLTKQVIRDEHASLAAMLQSLAMMVRMGPGEDRAAYFEVVRAMLFYIDEIPEKQHHPIESSLLFPRVVARVPEVGDVVARLDREHARGEETVRRLQHELLAWELLGDERRAVFEASVGIYLRFYEDHMRLEEEIVLPAAERSLSEADWAEMDQAFAANHDPLGRLLAGTGVSGLDPLYQQLFSRIIRLAPPPVGLGGA